MENEQGLPLDGGNQALRLRRGTTPRKLSVRSDKQGTLKAPRDPSWSFSGGDNKITTTPRQQSCGGSVPMSEKKQPGNTASLSNTDTHTVDLRRRPAQSSFAPKRKQGKQKTVCKPSEPKDTLSTSTTSLASATDSVFSRSQDSLTSNITVDSALGTSLTPATTVDSESTPNANAEGVKAPTLTRTKVKASRGSRKAGKASRKLSQGEKPRAERCNAIDTRESGSVARSCPPTATTVIWSPLNQQKTEVRGSAGTVRGNVGVLLPPSETALPSSEASKSERKSRFQEHF